MAQPDRRCRHHHQLWVGYALIFAVVVLLALEVTGAVQTHALRAKAAELDDRIGALKTEHQLAKDLLAEQARENRQQDDALVEQKRLMLRQEAAIARLARLRKQDSAALIGLHNDLVATHSNDARVRDRLLQLEANNAAATNVINATPPPVGGKVQP